MFGEAIRTNRLGDITQAAADGTFSRIIKSGGLGVEYPNGEVRIYGNQAPELQVDFPTSKSLGRFGMRLATSGPAMAFGEGYTFGDLDFVDPEDSEAIPPIDKLVKLGAQNPLPPRVETALRRLTAWRRTKNDPAAHYDISNEFFASFLSKDLTYSCAYWPDDPSSVSLEEAQERKVDHILSKLRLEPNQRLLDIGCGWGNLLLTAVERTEGLTGLGITVSKEQQQLAQQRAKERKLDGRVDFAVVDYQELAASPHFDHWRNRFDRVVSVGMYEHVGPARQARYFQALRRLLKPEGVTVLHTIGQQHEQPVNAWTEKYVFRGGYLPTLSGLAKLSAEAGLRDPDVESLRQHYALTLDAWRNNFHANLDTVRQLFDQGKIQHDLIRDPEQFIRMWDYYLATSSGSFRWGNLTVLQVAGTNGIDPRAPLTRGYMHD